MSAERIVSPVWELACDADGCDATYVAGDPWDARSDNSTRHAAEEEGWATRPGRGKGSRSAPDLCPAHAPGQAKQ